MDRIRKFLRKLDRSLRARMEEAIGAIHADRLGKLDIKPLQGHRNLYRCRIGSIRIIFVRSERGNEVIDINFRGNVYKRR